MNIELRPLRCFLQVVDSGGFGAAARVLNVSQPALSRTIRGLELQLGDRLFDRDTRNLALTALGLELKRTAERLVGEFDHSFERLGDMARGVRGTIVIGAIPTLAAALAPAALAKFAETFDEVTVVIRDSLTRTIIEGVAAGILDLGLTIQPPPSRDLSFRRLLSDRFLAIGDRRFEIGPEPMTWRTLSTQPFIAFDRDSSIRLATDSAFHHAGVAVEPRFECGELTTVGGLLGQGLGVSALPELALHQLAIDPQRRALITTSELTAPVATRNLGVLTSARRSLSPAARGFLGYLTSEARTLTVGRRLASESNGPAA